MVNSNKIVIGYIHVCQKDNWQLSYDMLFSSLKNGGLYDRTHEIRVGIVNDKGNIIQDERFNDPKIKIVVFRPSGEYERPTLSHMKNYANTDSDNTLYWYLHTKGIRHFGGPSEKCVIDWIKLMLYWNITQWKIAIEILNSYNTYGSSALHKQHYSGNFWWATVYHVRQLPYEIPGYYTGPEDYICLKNDKMYCIYYSGYEGGGHYSVEYPENIYKLPSDFNIDVYKFSNNDLSHLDYNELIKHYLSNGKNENKNYKIPECFDLYFYAQKYNLENLTDSQIISHLFNYGQYSLSDIEKYNMPEDFNFDFYRNYYEDMKDFQNDTIAWHWHAYGKNEGRIYKKNLSDIEKYNMPEDFNFDFYRNYYDDMKDFQNDTIAWHWHAYGKSEGRKYRE